MTTVCVHESQHFDRSLCACGSMHTYCNDCGAQLDACNEEQGEPEAIREPMPVSPEVAEGFPVPDWQPKTPDAGGSGFDAQAATINELQRKLELAVMVSLNETGAWPYTHDDYDDAHAALNELVRRAKGQA